MFDPSREQVREMFFGTWRNYRAGQPLAGIETLALDVILAHPEYHELLGSPDRYRDKEEIERWKQRDPIPDFANRLSLEGVLDEADLDRMEAEITAEVDDAVAFADAGSLEDVADLSRFVVSPQVVEEPTR